MLNIMKDYCLNWLLITFFFHQKLLHFAVVAREELETFRRLWFWGNMSIFIFAFKFDLHAGWTYLCQMSKEVSGVNFWISTAIHRRPLWFLLWKNHIASMILSSIFIYGDENALGHLVDKYLACASTGLSVTILWMVLDYCCTSLRQFQKWQIIKYVGCPVQWVQQNISIFCF